MLRVIKSQHINRVQDYSGPHHQLEFNACWGKYLNNPLLNSLYKPSVCFTERWFLESQRLIRDKLWYHPLLSIVVNDNNLKTTLVKSAVIDGTLMRDILALDNFPEYHISAGINLKKLNRWCSFFVSLPNSIETLLRLNGQFGD